MFFDQSRSAIERHLVDNWTETPVDYDNLPFNAGTEYIRPVIINGESSQMTLGPKALHRRPAILVIQIFVAKNSGTIRITKIADKLSELFKELQLGIIQFESPTLIRVGQTQKYHQENFQVPFTVDICEV